MTKHYERIDSSEKHLPAENFCGFGLHLCLQMCVCVNMADPCQLSWAGGGYVDNGIVSFHSLNRDRKKEIIFVYYILPRPGIQHKNR
jgi:hypothetical protein